RPRRPARLPRGRLRARLDERGGLRRRAQEPARGRLRRGLVGRGRRPEGVSLPADALAVLRRWRAPSTAQERLRERYVDHLAAHPDGLTRGCYPDHLTASTLVLSADLERVLLTLHAKAGRWFQFGGHCEAGDDSLVGAAAREAAEESGLTDLALDPVPVQL